MGRVPDRVRAVAGGVGRVGAAGVDKEDEVKGIYDLEEETAYYEEENTKLRAELARLTDYVNRLLNEESRIWKCETCGTEFESCFKGKWELERGDAALICPECGGVAVTLSSIQRKELARRDEIISRLKEDAERVIEMCYGVSRDGREYYKCPHCGMSGFMGSPILHTPDCPITLHRALMKELE